MPVVRTISKVCPEHRKLPIILWLRYSVHLPVPVPATTYLLLLVLYKKMRSLRVNIGKKIGKSKPMSSMTSDF